MSVETLAILEEEVEVTVGGEKFAEVDRVGHVTLCNPSSGSFIRLHLREGTWKWNAPLDDYDADTVSHVPADEPRWEAE